MCVTLFGDLPCESCRRGLCVSPYSATCLASLVGGGCVCVTLSSDLPCESCRRGVCVTLSGDLPCESCRRGVCVCHPIRRLALRVL